MNILIADDHTMFVDGIDSILQNEKDIDHISKCYDGKAVMDILNKEKIDVLLLDVNLPEMNGIEVCKAALEINPDLKILAISMFNEESFVSEILNNGAKGYILKNTGSEELLEAIRTVYTGETYFSKDVTETIMKGLMNKQKNGESKNNIPKISRREKDVLRLIMEEYTTQEIASELFISLKTVESHRSNLLSKLNARNTAGLVRITIEINLLG